MRGVWKRILPHFANSDFEEETVIEERTNIGREFGLDELGNDDVQELLSSHLEKLTDNPLLLNQQRAFEKADSYAEQKIICK
jgi:hypothetical protein